MFYSRVLLYYKVYSFLCFSNLFKNHSFNFLSKRYSRIHWPWINAWTYLICVGVSVGGLSLNPFLGLINNFGMSSVIQRQNIKLADLVLMAIADLNSMKLLASPSTIQQHLESKEWFLESSASHPHVGTILSSLGRSRLMWTHRPRWASSRGSLSKLSQSAYGPVCADWLGHVMRLT